MLSPEAEPHNLYSTSAIRYYANMELIAVFIFGIVIAHIADNAHLPHWAEITGFLFGTTSKILLSVAAVQAGRPIKQWIENRHPLSLQPFRHYLMNHQTKLSECTDHYCKLI